jgi:broad specificity phosphatase PhoE
MPALLLVRHGQASFGSDDYDRLSELGARQCEALGRYLHERGRRFEAVLTGTLRRHEQSLAAIASALPGLPPARCLRGLDEYDAEALVRAAAPGGFAPTAEGDSRREHFRLLRDGLELWMEGRIQPAGMRSWAEFRAGVAAALADVAAHHAGDVLIVSSGGPIATAVAQVLLAPPSSVIALNLQIRNSALTEFRFTARGHRLVTFNTLPHLDHPERAAWVSYA